MSGSKKSKVPKIILSKKVPSVAESVSIEYSEKYGKHMAANKDKNCRCRRSLHLFSSINQNLSCMFSLFDTSFEYPVVAVQ